jgi:putative DNA methylase
VVRGTAPEDYNDPVKFFSRTCFSSGVAEAEQQRGPEFLRLANALSTLYPRDSEEKRLHDAMLLAVPRG